MRDDDVVLPEVLTTYSARRPVFSITNFVWESMARSMRAFT
jgi:hypothetical protein